MTLMVLVFLPCVAGCNPAATALGGPVGIDAVASSQAGVLPSLDRFETAGSPAVLRQRGARMPALPQVFLDYPYPVVKGRQIRVRPGGDLQRALNDARRGDEIVLPAGATFTGNFTLPAKAGSVADGWITVRSDRSGQLPPVGTRVSPAHAPLMAKVVTHNQSGAIATAPGASGWRLVGLEVSILASVTDLNYALISLGTVGPSQSSMEQVPTDLVLDRMYIHALPETKTLRCIALNSARTQVSDSYVDECHTKGYDSQAIGGWNGPGPYKIVNNMLAGAGENLMFGGSDPSIPGLVPADIEIRRNYLFKPASWKGVWTIKNLLETKNAVRVLIEENVLDGSMADAQSGAAILLRSTNQSGGCAWCRTTDLIMRRNLIRNAGAGMIFVGSDNADTTLRRVLISENVFDGLNIAPYLGAHALAFAFVQGPQEITIERTVVVGPLTFCIRFDRSKPSTGVVLRDLVLARGQHGTGADGLAEGTPSLQVGAPGYVWSNMTIIGASNASYPSGTRFVSSEAQAPLAAQIRAIVQQATAGVP